jgi:thiamine-phosphate pyrophosphorylase
MSFKLSGLYIVTPDWDDTQKLLETTELALQGGAAIVQYRHKFAGRDLRRQQARALLELCRSHQRPLVINDHIDLCMEIGADGVHVGGTDASVAEARRQVGADKIVGASCYGEMPLARAARDAGASYVAFGGFYPSRVKKYSFVTPPSIIAQACQEIALPNVVIGGMTAENAVPLVQQGAHMVAAISSVYMTDDPRAAATSFTRLFTA